MTTTTETFEQTYIDEFQLLRFVRKTCLRMLESNATKGHGVWKALCLVVLRAHSDLEARFRQLWLDDMEIPGEQRLRETTGILQSAINRIQASSHMDADVSSADSQEDAEEDTVTSEPPEPLAKVGRRILFYLHRETRNMLETEDYECLAVWEHLLCLGLNLVWGTDEYRETLTRRDLPPDEKLRVGLDAIRDTLLRGNRSNVHYLRPDRSNDRALRRPLSYKQGIFLGDVKRRNLPAFLQP